MSKKKVKKKDKWGSIQNKQANDIYVAPKSKIESRANYAPEPGQMGRQDENIMMQVAYRMAALQHY